MGEAKSTWEIQERYQAPPSPAFRVLCCCLWVLCLPDPPARGVGSALPRPAVDRVRGREGCTAAEQEQFSQKMRSDVVLTKQRCFLQRLQKPTPCLPRHICAAEGETAGNRSFPDVIGMMPTVSPGDIRELAQEGLGGK